LTLSLKSKQKTEINESVVNYSVKIEKIRILAKFR